MKSRIARQLPEKMQRSKLPRFNFMLDPSYRTIAVASTFSPRFAKVLAEAKRMSERFECALSVIYVGKRTDETAARFSAAFERLRLPLDSAIHYHEGDPANAILQAAAAHHVDVIVAGAFKKLNIFWI